MSVIMHGGIGYSTRTKAAYAMSNTAINEDGRLFTTAKEKNQGNKAWASWGHDNLQPIRMAKDIENCGVLNAGLEAKARIACGKGIKPYIVKSVDKDGSEVLEFVDDSEINDWLEANDSYDLIYNRGYDKGSYGWSVAQIILNRARNRINRIKRTDVVECRLEKKDRNGRINNLYLSGDWSNGSEEYISKIPILEEGNEINDLQERISGYEFAIIDRELRNGRGYYPASSWYSTKAWVDIAINFPVVKEAQRKNEMTIKYLVTISENYWPRNYDAWDDFTEEQRKKVMQDKLDEIDAYLSGSENQYKSIFTTSYIDPATNQVIADIRIEVLDDKMKDGRGLADSSAAVSEILFALMINPALMGAGSPGGNAYSSNPGGSNIRESYLVQIQLMEPERRKHSALMKKISDFNGWTARIEKKGGRLVYRHDAGILTTLDTGKSTKNEIL